MEIRTLRYRGRCNRLRRQWESCRLEISRRAISQRAFADDKGCAPRKSGERECKQHRKKQCDDGFCHTQVFLQIMNRPPPPTLMFLFNQKRVSMLSCRDQDRNRCGEEKCTGFQHLPLRLDPHRSAHREFRGRMERRSRLTPNPAS